MIQGFRHRGLERFLRTGDARRIPAQFLNRLRRILTRLNIARTVQDMNYPGSNLHPLKGDLDGFWSVRVSGNWRVIFRFEDGDAFDVDLVDYH